MWHLEFCWILKTPEPTKQQETMAWGDWLKWIHAQVSHSKWHMPMKHVHDRPTHRGNAPHNVPLPWLAPTREVHRSDRSQRANVIKKMGVSMSKEGEIICGEKICHTESRERTKSAVNVIAIDKKLSIVREWIVWDTQDSVPWISEPSVMAVIQMYIAVL